MIDPNYFQNYECIYIVVDVDEDEIVQKSVIIAPRFVHERTVLSLIQEASKAKHHLKVMIRRYEYIDGCNDPLLLNITYQNH